MPACIRSLPHAERCAAMRKNRKLAFALRDIGVCIQVNANSIFGYDGAIYKRFAPYLLKEDQIDMVGSDSHNMDERVSHLKQCAVFVSRKIRLKSSADCSEKMQGM